MQSLRLSEPEKPLLTRFYLFRNQPLRTHKTTNLIGTESFNNLEDLLKHEFQLDFHEKA